MGGKPALGAARALDGLGAIHMRAGRHTAARLRFEEALAIKEGAGTAPGEVTASLVRLGSALLLLAESPYVGDRGRAALREAKGAFAEAARLCPESREAQRGVREAGLAWAAEFDSDEE